MKKTLKVIKSSDLYNKIDALKLTPSERREAVGALGMADKVADALYAGLMWLRRVSSTNASNPKLKHQ